MRENFLTRIINVFNFIFDFGLSNNFGFLDEIIEIFLFFEEVLYFGLRVDLLRGDDHGVEDALSVELLDFLHAFLPVGPLDMVLGDLTVEGVRHNLGFFGKDLEYQVVQSVWPVHIVDID